MAMAKKARKLVVFASIFLAGSSLATVSAQAHTKKHDHQTHASAAHHNTGHSVASAHGGNRKHSHDVAVHHGRSGKHSSLASAGATRGGHVQMQRVTLVTHRHGRKIIRTVWRPLDRNSRRLADNVYASGAYQGGWLECVPYARRVSGIGLTGNAYTWWDEAAGRYARGHTPAAGSVLNFRNNGRMRLGHVAVVTEVVGAREVLVTQANWGGPGFRRGGVSDGISVVDVSPRNDWTAVRVALGHSATYGSIYPTYGFIYGRSSDSTRIADAVSTAPQLLTDRPPSDLRSPRQRGLSGTPFAQTVQFASAPSFDGQAIATSAPDRSIR
jgi:hypothetical protein